VSLYIHDAEFEKLSPAYKAIVEAASRVAHVAMTSRYDALNAAALRRLIAGGTQLRPFPREVMDASYKAATTVYDEFSAKDPKFKSIYTNYMAFRDSVVPWFRVAEGAYDQYLGVALSQAGHQK